MKISLHIHSKHSMDLKLRVSDIISQSLIQGFSTIAITDHNSVAGSIEAFNLQPKNLNIIIGAEWGIINY